MYKIINNEIIINKNCYRVLNLANCKGQPITKISFRPHSKFNGIIINIPESVNKIDLIQCTKYNKSLNWLPSTITHLILGCQFNKPLDNLPINLKVLEINSN